MTDLLRAAVALAAAAALAPLAGRASAAEAAAPAPSSNAARPAPVPSGDWRAARFGMTLPELLAAVPEAARLDPPVKLEDGAALLAGIERVEQDGQRFRVRFVFEGGRLALVSLRTPEEAPAPPEAFAAMEQALVARFGEPLERARDDNFVDLRQTRWRVGRSRVDLKYVPGVMVLLWSLEPGAAKAP